MKSQVKRFLEVARAFRRSEMSGDFAAACIAGLVTGLPLHLYGPGGSVWGVPLSLVWAGVAACAVGFASLSIGQSQ